MVHDRAAGILHVIAQVVIFLIFYDPFFSAECSDIVCTSFLTLPRRESYLLPKVSLPRLKSVAVIVHVIPDSNNVYPANNLNLTYQSLRVCR